MIYDDYAGGIAYAGDGGDPVKGPKQSEFS